VLGAEAAGLREGRVGQVPQRQRGELRIDLGLTIVHAA
jgi:hypothetical protein